MTYSLSKKKEILRLYCRNNNCPRAAARSSNEDFTSKNVHLKYVMELIGKFDAVTNIRTVTNEIA